MGKNAAIIFTMRVGADLSCHYQYPLYIILEKGKKEKIPTCTQRLKITYLHEIALCI